MRRYWITLLTTTIPFILTAQVSNDNIANRIRLEHNTPHISNTTGCTVEQDCVDPTLTGKCIKYHNDQWFTFESSIKQTVFANIYGQNCRDFKGVQLVVFDGVPCEPSTYNVLTCVSLASQDNFYIELNLEANKEYLLNVDGYLHDHCEFFISIDSASYGFPTFANFPLATQAIRAMEDITLKWKLPDSLSQSINSFEIYRRKYKQLRYEHISTVDVIRNAYGTTQENYQYIDITGKFRKMYYKLVAIDNHDNKLVIDEFEF